MSSSEKRAGSAKSSKAKTSSAKAKPGTSKSTDNVRPKTPVQDKDKGKASSKENDKPKKKRTASTQSETMTSEVGVATNGDVQLANGHVASGMSSSLSSAEAQASVLVLQDRLSVMEDRLSVFSSGMDFHRCLADENVVIAMSQLALTKAAPQFSGTAVVDGEFKEISLSDYKGKYLVFFFYPLDFTFVCPTELIAFSDRVDEFNAINCNVVACSTDSHFSHLAWINTPRKQGGIGQMNMAMLADKNCDIARAYGVYKEDAGIAFRGLFIIDDKGNLRQITINDLPVGRSVDEVLRLVQAFQFTDKHGEVCPAGWKPGAKTMKPDPKGSKAYFQEAN